MQKIYSKIDPNLLLLVINRKGEIDIQRTDLSPAEQYMQVATKKLAKNTFFKPHKHNHLERTTTTTQEAWVFLDGKVNAKFWDIDDGLIYETILLAGDCAVVFHGGHSFEVLEDNTILYEFKNGPYYGTEKDKTYIREN
tara:strand:+ start:3345 stop:3761 length:417 start_codon:yes stop_codon:yes gene_type:complete